MKITDIKSLHGVILIAAFYHDDEISCLMDDDLMTSEVKTGGFS